MSIISDGVYVRSQEVARPARLYWPAHDLLPHDRPGGRLMNAEFNWWLLIVGLVVGAALTWLVMADLARRDADVDATEHVGEAHWIARILTDAGRPVAADRVLEVLRLHREYLSSPPPDDPLVGAEDEETTGAFAPPPGQPTESASISGAIPDEPGS
jgi:hypothetical protein